MRGMRAARPPCLYQNRELLSYTILSSSGAQSHHWSRVHLIHHRISLAEVREHPPHSPRMVFARRALLTTVLDGWKSSSDYPNLMMTA